MLENEMTTVVFIAVNGNVARDYSDHLQNYNLDTMFHIPRVGEIVLRIYSLSATHATLLKALKNGNLIGLKVPLSEVLRDAKAKLVNISNSV